jgi:hypothetical protein
MNRTLRSYGWWAASAAMALVILAASAVSADVTIKRVSVVKGLGGMMNSTVTSTETVQGDKMVSDHETKMDSKLMKLMGAGKPVTTTSIIRLDKELFWDINHKDKTYTELTFAQMRQMMDSLGAMMSGGSAMGQQKAAFDTSEYKLLPPKFDIKRTGKTETISGYACSEALMTMETVAINRKTGDTVLLDVNISSMLAKNVPGEAEMAAFGKKMAQAIGTDVDQGAGQSMEKMLGMYGIDAKKIAEESKKLEGFAMRTEMTFGMGGGAMTQAADASKSGKEQEKSKDAENAKSDESSSNDGGGLAGKALGGLFGKKKKAEPKEEAGGKSGDLAPGAMFSVVTTVMEIGTAAAGAVSFDVPAGYKLEKRELEKKNK